MESQEKGFTVGELMLVIATLTIAFLAWNAFSNGEKGTDTSKTTTSSLVRNI